ncbi:MAG: radical SAM protein [Lachnospiraceae bacterium]|nr:radical SAM protein [Lachnospiraceae bacterium]
MDPNNERKLELVHFQITKNCNLRCWFCGQWGNRGFFSDAAGSQMEWKDWKNVIAQLVAYREKTGASPDILLWGGEPLLCPFFEKLALLLRENGFALGLVTNGTRMDRYASLLRQEFCHIYVSVDGDRESHDRVRGKGVFDKVSGNLELIRGGNAQISIMAVITRDNLDKLLKLPDTLCALPCDEVILQDQIALSQKEAAEYALWMKECFGMDAAEIDSWVADGVDEKQKKEALTKILANRYPKKVTWLPHGQSLSYCRSPFSHIHIAWDGNVLYCTDFYDFSAGNVKEKPLMEIFENDLSEKFRDEIRKGHCVTCRHCSWINSKNFYLQTMREI